MNRSTKFVVTLWMLAIAILSFLAGSYRSKVEHVPIHATFQKVAADENGLDSEKKTFPLHRKFPDHVIACYTPEAAHQMALAIKNKDEAIPLIARLLDCFDGIVPITYSKHVETVNMDDGAIRIYQGKVGSITIFVLTDWKADGGIDA